MTEDKENEREGMRQQKGRATKTEKEKSAD